MGFPAFPHFCSPCKNFLLTSDINALSNIANIFFLISSGFNLSWFLKNVSVGV